MKEVSAALQLPKGWVKCSLGDIIKVKSGSNLTSQAMIEEGKHSVYGGNGVSGYFNDFLFEEEKLIIGRVGAKCGIVHITKPKSWVTDNALVVDFDERNIHKQFLFWCLDNLNLNKYSASTAQPVISGAKIYKVSLSLPPLAEQHRIVAKIEELFSELDNGVAQLKQVQVQLKSYRQSVLKHAFEGKLTEAYRNQQSQTLPPAQELLNAIRQERKDRHQRALKDWQQAVIRWAETGEHGKKPGKPKAPKELPPLTDEEIEKLPALPEGWAWVRLGNTIETIFDGPFGSNLKTDDYVEEGIRVIRLENIGYLEFNENKETFISEEKYRSLEKHTVYSGDIVFSSFIADNIRCVVLPNSIDKAINKADCFCIRNNNGLMSQIYLAYLLSARQSYKNLSLRVHGATRPRINTTQLKELPIPLCSTEEQHQIVQEIESRLSVAEHLEKTVEESLRQAEVLRQSILQRAFTGQLVPQDPNDEPAAELLKRIQEEKSGGKKKAVEAKASGMQTDEQLSITF